MMYADVIVDISLEKLDRVFQYRIPPALEKSIVVGSQILIPFGKGNRRMRGYVVGLSDYTDYPVEKIKSVLQLLNRSTTIESRMIALAWWMRKQYGGTMSQALRTVIPVKQKIKGKEKRFLSLAVEQDIAAAYIVQHGKRSKAKAKVLGELLEKRRVPMDWITGDLGVSASVVNGLKEEGLVLVESEGIYRIPSFLAKGERGEGHRLSIQQQAIVDDFGNDYQRGIRRVYLLHGVTGSGKTEVYMELIRGVIAKGKQAIVLIPEIALTYQTVMRFYRGFGNRVSIMNSRMSQGERYDQYERAKTGEIDIMIGPRSALFTPFQELGLIIIDEEHETTYKSDTIPKYHARETAVELARLADASVVLGSATPSLESFYLAKKGEYRYYELPERIGTRQLPQVEVVDLREELKSGNKSMFSRSLKEKIETRLNRRQQTILFINRRGYAGFVSCRACGKAVGCPHCDVTLTVHNNGTLRCHYCGYTISIPKQCPVCASSYIAAFGTGTQKVEEAVKKEFPQARVLRMDADTTAGKDGHQKVLSVFSKQGADILIGTQMIVKGHDFPHVTLVGVIAADLSLFANDYHSSERTFELLVQAAGRAGRGEEAGEVVIQTYNPEHYSIVTAAKQDYFAFYKQEILYRRLLSYPPVGNMMAILAMAKEEKEGENLLERLKEEMQESCSRMGIMTVGPTSASVGKIQDVYRSVMYLKNSRIADILTIKEKMEEYLNTEDGAKEIQVQFDVNPVHIY